METKFSNMPMPETKEPYYDYLIRLNEWVDMIPESSRRTAYFDSDYDTGFPHVVYKVKEENGKE